MTLPADPNTRLPEEVLVHGSPDRTIISRRDPVGGARELWKILETGSMADAAREVDLGRQLKGLGVATYLEARQEDGSGRPVVVMAHHDGQDLEDLLARSGALEPPMALAIAAAVARILARLHEARLADAPLGVVHGDIKPSNILCNPARLAQPDGVLLLDLEHACAIGADDRGGFSGGTRGFAPPEADLGAAPTAAFDIYALGATLQSLLTGHHPDHSERGQLAGMPLGIASLLDQCLSVDPEARPTAADLAAALDRLRARPADPLDEVLSQLQQGRVGDALQQLETGAAHDPGSIRAHALQAWAASSVEHAPDAPASIGPLADEPSPKSLAAYGGRVADAARQVQARLDHFPRCRTTLERRRECRQCAALVLAELPKALQTLEREADFPAARDLLQAGRRTVEAILAQPGSFAIPGVSPRLLNPLQRSPLHFLERAEQRLEEAAAEHQSTLDRLGEAEENLDLDRMEAVIDEVAREGGGARMAVATLRDRVHRLGFYLDRLGAQRQAIDQFAGDLEAAAVAVDLTATREFVDRCAAQAPGLLRQREEDRGLDLRRLRRTLGDLHREFPQVDTSIALSSLEAAMGAITDRAWKLVADAEAQLRSVPVPVRPLQTTLNRLDAWAMAGAFVDRAQRTRAELLDAIDSVRLEVERARATRDRMASGAEEAMAKGHWTTALYDMERAVEQFTAEDGLDTSDDDGLSQRYAEVKKRKAEIEQVMRRNVELASSYTALQDSPAGTTEARLEVLEARRTALQFLVEQLQEDRALRYRQDLKDVEVLMIQEHAARAEKRLDDSDDPHEWVRLARQTLALMESPMAQASGSAPGRVQRMIEHWQHRLEQAQKEVDRRSEEDRRQRHARGRQRLLRAGALAVGALVAILAWQFGPALMSESRASGRGADASAAALIDALAEPGSAGLPQLAALGERLRDSGGILGAELATRAGGLADRVAAIAEAEDASAAVRAFGAEHRAFEQVLAATRADLADDLHAAMAQFGGRARDLAEVLADRRGVGF